ncbi:hypothetical protein [Streptomyces sp. NPDC091212]|uniref:hypothetical protein n=1 Tax=Streptomyces sp. NPDC091212 TaxID=3155191 RepID=UPI003447420C
MVAQDPTAFENVAFSFTSSDVFRRAVDAAMSKALRSRDGEWADRLVKNAWLSLPEAEQQRAFNDLCCSYYLKLSEERTAHVHDALGTSGTYLQPDDLPLIHEALMNAGPIEEDTLADGFLAGSLDRVLKELELLRYRLAIAQHESA